jgi:hypothetical protein
MIRASCEVATEPTLNGVRIRVAWVDDGGKVVNSAQVVYTPELARRVASDILAMADAVDALGGASPELRGLCKPGRSA